MICMEGSVPIPRPRLETNPHEPLLHDIEVCGELLCQFGGVSERFLCLGPLAVSCLGGWQWVVWETLRSFVCEGGSELSGRVAALCLGGWQRFVSVSGRAAVMCVGEFTPARHDPIGSLLESSIESRRCPLCRAGCASR